MPGSVWYRENFDATDAVEKLYEATIGQVGTDEDVVVQIMGNHNWKQRIEIAESFKAAYGKDLKDAIKEELTGDFEDVVVAMLTPPKLLDVIDIHDAMSGLGTDEITLIEVLATKTNYELEQLKEAYREKYDEELEDAIKSETGGCFENLMVSLVSGARQENNFDVDEDQAQEDAQAFYDAGEAKWGTDEGAMNAILCLRSRPQLALTFEKFRELADKTIQESIEDECGDSLKDGFLAIVETTQNMPKFFAKRIKKCTECIGTDDAHLQRIIVTRSEIDMEEIEKEFYDMYETTVAEVIESECSGDYKKMLLALIAISD